MLWFFVVEQGSREAGMSPFKKDQREACICWEEGERRNLLHSLWDKKRVAAVISQVILFDVWSYGIPTYYPLLLDSDMEIKEYLNKANLQSEFQGSPHRGLL